MGGEGVVHRRIVDGKHLFGFIYSLGQLAICVLFAYTITLTVRLLLNLNCNCKLQLKLGRITLLLLPVNLKLNRSMKNLTVGTFCVKLSRSRFFNKNEL
jgi:hypothetical protein